MVQRKVVRGARIVRFENGKRMSYADGALVWLTDVELVKYQFITEPVPEVKVPVARSPVQSVAAPAAAKQEVKHEVRNVVPPTAFGAKK